MGRLGERAVASGSMVDRVPPLGQVIQFETFPSEVLDPGIRNGDHGGSAPRLRGAGVLRSQATRMSEVLTVDGRASSTNFR
jgi:hypothetical protein